jgi:hypothetical protein
LDFLRFDENEIINIELKRYSTPENLLKQHLNFLEKEVHTYTFIVEDSRLFYLGEDGVLHNAVFRDLVTRLNSQSLEDIVDIVYLTLQII